MTLVVGRRGWFSGGGGGCGGLDGPDRVRVRVFADRRRRRRRRGRRSVAVSSAPSATFAPVIGWDNDDDAGPDRSLATSEIWWQCRRRPRRTVAGQRDRRRPSC